MDGAQATPKDSPAASLRHLLAAALLSTVLVFTLYAVVTEREGLYADDAGQYVRMAESPAYLARLPYTLRVLTPSLAAALPGTVLNGFVVVTIVSLVLACTALYAYQRVLGLAHATALAGAALYALSGGPIRMLTTPTYVDSLTYFVEALALFALASGRFWVFMVALVLGVMNRETALLLVPLYFMTGAAAGRRSRAGFVVIVVPLVALGAVAALKLWSGPPITSELLSSLAPFSRTFRQDLPALTDLFDLYSTFGAMWLLAAVHLPGPTRLQRGALVFGALVILQLLVSRGDEGRNLSHLFVIIIPLAMLEVERLLTSPIARDRALSGILVVGFAASMVHARWTIVEPAVVRYALVASGTAIALAIPLLTRRMVSERGAS